MGSKLNNLMLTHQIILQSKYFFHISYNLAADKILGEKLAKMQTQKLKIINTQAVLVIFECKPLCMKIAYPAVQLFVT